MWRRFDINLDKLHFFQAAPLSSDAECALVISTRWPRVPVNFHACTWYLLRYKARWLRCRINYHRIKAIGQLKYWVSDNDSSLVSQAWGRTQWIIRRETEAKKWMPKTKMKYVENKNATERPSTYSRGFKDIIAFPSSQTIGPFVVADWKHYTWLSDVK